MLLRDWSISLITPVGNVRPPKASGGRPLCPKDLVDKVRQFVTPCKKKTNKHFDYCYLQGSVWKYPSQRLVHYARKKWKPYKPHVTVPLAVARLAGRLVFCDWILQKPEGLKSMWYGRIRHGFCCKLVPSSRTKDIELLWAIEWLWRARNRGRGIEK